jgi:hypothetical protein
MSTIGRDPAVQGDPLPLLALHERARYRAAADYALRRYPGPVGELIHRELSAYADFGHRFAHDALIPHLAADVLTPPGRILRDPCAPDDDRVEPAA